MRKWIKNWLDGGNKRKLSISVDSAVCETKSSGSISRNYEDTNVINFRVFGANGGKIVETLRYDPKAGREVADLYLISEDEDFHSSLGKIITLAYLR